MRGKIVVCLSMFLLCASSAYSGEIERTVSFSRNDLTFSKSEGYDIVDLKGYPGTVGTGEPRLPRVVHALVIPAGADPTGVEIVSRDMTEIAGTYNITPARPHVPLPMPGEVFVPHEVEPDPVIYLLGKPYPELEISIIGVGRMNGYQIVHVEIFPVRYVPASKLIQMATSITYKLKYAESSTSVSIPTVLQREMFGNAVRSVVMNPEDMSSFSLAVGKSLSRVLLPSDNYPYVIITQPPMDTVFQRLADWKTRKGVRATVVTVDWITANYTGYDTQEAIRNFIIDAKNTWGTVYVLLGGQADQKTAGQNIVPARRAFYTISGVSHYSDEDTIPSDLYYSDLDGTWDGDGDHTYGELTDNVDMYADVYVGRAPVYTVAQAQNFVYKALTYEKSPPSSHIKKLMLPTAILWSSYEERPIQDSIARMTPASWFDAKMYERDGTLSRQGMIDSLDAGYGMGHWEGHGDENGIYMGAPFLTSSDADNLVNGDRLGIVNSIACFTGAWDQTPGGDCFAERLVNRVGGGLVAAIMNSRYGWGGYVGGYVPGPSERIDTTFYARIFQNGMYRAGAVHAAAKDAWVPYADSGNQYDMTRWCIYDLNLMGDPELPLWTDVPDTLNVAHNAVVPMGTSSFTVIVTNNGTGAPVESAFVCCMMDSTVYEIGYTNGAGLVMLSVTPVRLDTMWVTASAQNYIPSEGYALVICPGGPYISYLTHSIDDDNSGASLGNGDSIVDANEIIELPVSVVNYGSDTGYTVQGTLRTADTFVTITDSSELFGDMAPGDTAHTSSFVFEVDSTCPNNHVIQFELVCKDSSDSTWTSGFSVGTAVYAVDVLPQSQDSSGFENDTLWYVLMIENKGTSPDSYDLSVAGNSWTTTIWNSMGTSQITNTGTILRDSSVNVLVRVDIPGSISNGEIDTVQLRAVSTVYPTVSDSGAIRTSGYAMYSLPFEDSFETALGNWNLSGTANWAIYAGTGQRGTGGAYEGDSVMVMTCTSSGTYSWSYADVYLKLAGETQVAFDCYWRTYSLSGSEYIYLDVYDGTWHLGVDSLTGNDTDWQNVHLGLSGYNMIDGFIVRFRAYMNYYESSDAAYVDKVRIYRVEYGSVAGTITDVGTSLPVEGAVVEVSGAGLLDTSDVNGEYQVDGIETSTYDVTCTASDYLSQTEYNVSVLANDTTIVDFALTAPDIEASPDSLGASLALNDSTTDTLFISNTGTDTLVFSISESDTGGLKALYHKSGTLSPGVEKELTAAYGTGDNLSEGQTTTGQTIAAIDWLSENPISGSVPPGETDTILIAFNSTGLTPDSTYKAWLKINSNDPDEPIVSVPCTLHVQGIPIVNYNGHFIDDDSTGESTGNNNGIPEAGETVEVPVALINTGSDSAYGVSAIISTADSFITLTDTIEDFGDIPPDSTALCLDDYVFSVDPACPDSHTVTFMLDITEISHSWIDSFDIMIRHYGDISGQITDRATGLGIPGAMVTYTGQATGVDTADGTGNYFIADMAGGTYLLTASAAGFLSSNPVNATIPPDTVIDFVLGVPDIHVSPDSLEASLALDDSLTRTLLISNTGSDTLTFTIFESDSGLIKLTNATSLRKAGRMTHGGSGAGMNPSRRRRLPFSSASPSSFVSSPLSSSEDTICYDDSTAAWYLGIANAYYAVRFTPTEGCRVFAGLAMAFDPNLVGAPCSLFVWNDNGGVPGNVVAGPIAYTPLGYPNWDRVSLPLPVGAAGDFHLGYWVSGDPTGQYALMDNDGGARSLHSTDGGASWTALGSSGDIMIRAIVEYNPIEWLSENPTSGSVPPGETDTIFVTFNSTGLVMDSTYKAWINVGSNDPDEPVVLVPVTLTVVDTSLPQVTVISPDSGEVWFAGATDTIRWEATDDSGIDSVSIHLSLDGGSSYPDTIARGETNDSAYAWTLPDTFSATCRIKVIVWDIAENRAEDESNYDFMIAHGQKGDVNGDGEVTILDIQRMVNIIQERGTLPTSYELWAADVNEDGEINILDIMEAINIIQGYEGTVTETAQLLKRIGMSVGREVLLTQSTRLMTRSSRRMTHAPQLVAHKTFHMTHDTAVVSIPCDSGLVGTDSNMIYVNLENLVGVGAVQIRIGYDTLLTAREADTTFRSGMMSIDSKIDSNYIQILLLNMSDDTIAPGVGPIIRIPFYISSEAEQGDSALLHVERLILSDVDAGEIPSQGVNGWLHFRGINVEDEDILPQKYELSGVFPNPITRQATIRYAIPERSHTTLKVYDVSGKLVRTLVDGHQKPAYYSVAWLGRDNHGRRLPPGVYFVRFSARNTDASAQVREHKSVGKVILVK